MPLATSFFPAATWNNTVNTTAWDPSQKKSDTTNRATALFGNNFNPEWVKSQPMNGAVDFATASDSELMYGKPDQMYYNVPGVPGALNTGQLGNWYDDRKQEYYPGYVRQHDQPSATNPPSNTQAPTQSAPQATQGNGQWSGMYRPMGYESWMPIRPTDAVPMSTFMPGAK